MAADGIGSEDGAGGVPVLGIDDQLHSDPKEDEGVDPAFLEQLGTAADPRHVLPWARHGDDAVRFDDGRPVRRLRR